jgi:hypothetical protein
MGLEDSSKALAAELAEEQVNTHTGMTAPGRTKEAPLPTGEAARVLRAGSYS